MLPALSPYNNGRPASAVAGFDGDRLGADIDGDRFRVLEKSMEIFITVTDKQKKNFEGFLFRP